jgi:hypothetical protein
MKYYAEGLDRQSMRVLLTDNRCLVTNQLNSSFLQIVWSWFWSTTCIACILLSQEPGTEI